MDGTIHVDSVKRKGTIVDVILPFEMDSFNLRQKEVEKEEKISIQGMNILLVEDNELNMEITQFFSKKKGLL